MLTTSDIRLAKLGDEDGIAKVHVACWKTTYVGIVPQPALDKLSVSKRIVKWREILISPNDKQQTFVALNTNAEIVGFVNVGISREPTFPYSGELTSIYLLKERQGCGIGRSLFEVGVRWLQENKYESMFLWVLRENPTLGFYKHMGGTIFTTKKVELGGKELEELGVGWDKFR
jgi:GNAT superfamily N-acetyltransferase